MRIVLSTEVASTGVTESDIQNMLKACDRELLVKEFKPSLKEVQQLVVAATKAEQAKSRTVAKWNNVMSKLSLLVR